MENYEVFKNQTGIDKSIEVVVSENNPDDPSFLKIPFKITYLRETHPKQHVLSHMSKSTRRKINKGYLYLDSQLRFFKENTVFHFNLYYLYCRNIPY